MAEMLRINGSTIFRSAVLFRINRPVAHHLLSERLLILSPPQNPFQAHRRRRLTFPLSSHFRAIAFHSGKELRQQKEPNDGCGDGDACRCSGRHGNVTSNRQLYLHVGPSGDCWIGESLFAAKHLQPDYVKSIKLPECRDGAAERLVETIERNPELGQVLYDTEQLPTSLLTELSEET